MHDYETVKNFIRLRVQEVNQMEAHEQDKESRQGITLRLARGQVALADRLAKELAFTRQDFLAYLIDVALQDSVKAMLDLVPEEERLALFKDYYATAEEGAHHE